MQQTSVTDSFRKFIMIHFPASKRSAFHDDDSLLESGIVDSMGVLDLVSFIEGEFKISVDDEDLTPENFESINRMAAFVERKQRDDA